MATAFFHSANPPDIPTFFNEPPGADKECLSLSNSQLSLPSGGGEKKSHLTTPLNVEGRGLSTTSSKPPLNVEGRGKKGLPTTFSKPPLTIESKGGKDLPTTSSKPPLAIGSKGGKGLPTTFSKPPLAIESKEGKGLPTRPELNIHSFLPIIYLFYSSYPRLLFKLALPIIQVIIAHYSNETPSKLHKKGGQWTKTNVMRKRWTTN